MTGVHIIALVSALVTITVIVELTRRRYINERFAVVWLLVAVVIGFFAIFPGIFNSLAHAVGVKDPPSLLSVLGVLFLLIVCVRLSWEVGRLQERTEVLAEEIALDHIAHGLCLLETPAYPPDGWLPSRSAMTGTSRRRCQSPCAPATPPRPRGCASPAGRAPPPASSSQADRTRSR